MSSPTPTRAAKPRQLARPSRASAEHVDKSYPLWFHIPGGLVYLVLFIVPTVFSFYFAFTRWTLFKASFIGLDNFVLFFQEPGLIGSLKNTLIYGFVTSGAKVVLGMLLAVVLSAPIIARGYLRSVTEVLGIEQREGIVTAPGSRGSIALTGNEPVSLNLWGFTPALFEALESDFGTFLAERINDERAEFFLPEVVNRGVSIGASRVRLLPTEDPWFGITHPADAPLVSARLRLLVRAGLYPSPLFAT